MGHTWWYHDGRGTIDKLAGMISFDASETALMLFSPSGALDLASATPLALRALARISVKGEIQRRQFAVVEDRHLSVGGCDGRKQGARQRWDPSVALLHLQTGGFAARERRGRTTSFPEGEWKITAIFAFGYFRSFEGAPGPGTLTFSVHKVNSRWSRLACRLARFDGARGEFLNFVQPCCRFGRLLFTCVGNRGRCLARFYLFCVSSACGLALENVGRRESALAHAARSGSFGTHGPCQRVKMKKAMRVCGRQGLMFAVTKTRINCVIYSP